MPLSMSTIQSAYCYALDVSALEGGYGRECAAHLFLTDTRIMVHRAQHRS